MFIDRTKIFIKSGDGGHGHVAFRREKYIPAGGPNGGDGGKGGDIIFEVDSNMLTLLDFRYKRKFIAQNGGGGEACNRSGSDASNLVIKVPAGTIVKDEDTGQIYADLVEIGQREVILKGGNGGKGNQHFATSTRQAPKFAESGTPGFEVNVILELKMIADVGLVGFPNVGKSTILSVVTAAKPKIANYHFTTISPNIGVVGNDFGKSFVLADIPGLIEGAHEGVGLGHEFLRHVERTKLLIHVIDISGIEGRNPIDDFEKINNELHMYSPKLKEKLQVVVANKIDVLFEKEKYEEFKVAIEAKGYKVFPISAVTTEGLKDLFTYVVSKLEEISTAPKPLDFEENESKIYTQDKEELFTIRVEDDTYIIEGRWMQRLVWSTNFSDDESLKYFQRLLKKKGIIDELEKMGINEGDSVKIYDIEFDYIR